MEFKNIVVLVITTTVVIITAASEPRYHSYFDFQEKILEKMVVLTDKMDNLDKAFVVYQKELNDRTEKIRKDTSKMENDLMKFAKDLRHEIRHKTQTQFMSQKQEITELRDKVKNLMNEASELLKSLEVRINRLSIDVQEFAQKSKDDLHEAHITNLAEIENQLENFTTTAKIQITELMKSSEEKIATLSKDVQKYSNKTHNVAFLVRTVSNTSPGENAKLIFTTAIVNTDNCYSNQTGTFIAPVNGTYWFSAQICSVVSQYVNFRIYVNEVMMSDTTHYDTGSSYDCTTASTVGLMSMGDKAYIKTGSKTSSGSVINHDEFTWSMFSGALVN